MELPRHQPHRGPWREPHGSDRHRHKDRGHQQAGQDGDGEPSHGCRSWTRDSSPSTSRGPGRRIRSESTRKTLPWATASMAENPGRFATAFGDTPDSEATRYTAGPSATSDSTDHSG